MLSFHLKLRKPCLEAVIPAIIAVFELKSFQEHDSLNYPPFGRYFMGTGDRFKVKVVEEDTIGFEDFHYEVHLHSIDSISEEQNEAFVFNLLKFVERIGIPNWHTSTQTCRREFWLDPMGVLQTSTVTVNHTT